MARNSIGLISQKKRYQQPFTNLSITLGIIKTLFMDNCIKSENNVCLYSFKGNATRISRLIRDELVPSKETAAYWIEHVIRHNGTKHLQLLSKHMPFYQRHLLDVTHFLIVISTVFLVLTIAALRWTIFKCYIISEKKNKFDQNIFSLLYCYTSTGKI